MFSIGFQQTDNYTSPNRTLQFRKTVKFRTDPPKASYKIVAANKSRKQRHTEKTVKNGIESISPKCVYSCGEQIR